MACRGYTTLSGLSTVKCVDHLPRECPEKSYPKQGYHGFSRFSAQNWRMLDPRNSRTKDVPDNGDEDDQPATKRRKVV